MEKLPAVAKNIYYPCSKCQADRYHRVLAHLSNTEARLECEVCRSKRKYKIGAPAKTAGVRRVAGSGGSGGRPRTSHLNNWTELTEKYSKSPTSSYSLQGSFRPNTLIDHPTFGVGVVMEAYPTKIEVCFQVGMKTLLHQRD